ncbi:MAG: acetylxylan esterase [Candidatus Hydrogenedentes bacterium]|nr:acetylxylan esterase [Candidatus Hydrogenedentota bacterium]
MDSTPWPARRETIKAGWLDMLGPFPNEIPPLDVRMRRVDDIEGIECHHVVFQCEAGAVDEDSPPDIKALRLVTGYLLIPEGARERRGPAVVCIHSTTHGAGKGRIVGLTGSSPGDPPDPPGTSRAYGLELARWGYVTFSFDLICDGERIVPGSAQHDTSWFYAHHPEWSAVGKNLWDTMRAVDFLHTLDFVDPARIGCVGHSLGGHSTLFAGAFDDRIAAAVPNCGVLSWDRPNDHWARKGDNKQGVSGYIYIPNFRPYVEDPSKPVPVDFEHLMMLVAPRPLLVQCTEGEAARDAITERVAAAGAVYRELGAGDRIALFTFPGEHNYPPVAKRHSFAWLDRWLDHTPAVPSIWPGVPI